MTQRNLFAVVAPLTIATFAAQVAGLLDAGALPITCAQTWSIALAIGGGIVAGCVEGRGIATRFGASVVFVTYTALLAELTSAYVGWRHGRILLPELLLPNAVAVTVCLPLRRVVNRWQKEVPLIADDAAPRNDDRERLDLH